jgi:hypothetical protein
MYDKVSETLIVAMKFYITPPGVMVHNTKR